MQRIPFGVSQLDTLIGGGAPAGSVVLLAGESGAGAREFAFTGAAMAALASEDPELFRLHYGESHEGAGFPDETHYISLTTSAEELRAEMQLAMDPELIGKGLDGMDIADLSAEYFQLSPVPRDWYAGSRGSLAELGSPDDRRDVIEALADYFDEHATDSFLVVDSLTDLVSVRGANFEWREIVYLLKGLRKAARRWGGLILLHVGRESIPEHRFGDLMTSVDGTMLFEWAGTGNERLRTLVVREFRGVLSQLEDEDIARFETDIDDAGFDISNIRRLR